MADFSIRATPDGPYIVQGATALLDTSGDKYPLEKDTHRAVSVRPLE